MAEAKLDGVLHRRFRAMGTDVHILLNGGDLTHLGFAESKILDLEKMWSRFIPSSEICQLNKNPEQLVVVTPETFMVIRQAVEAWMLTDGLFDPTVEASMMAAGYTRNYSDLAGERGVHPITGIMPSPTPQGIVIDEAIGAVSLPKGVTLDLGGIGKGAAADLVAEELVALGAEGCIVSLGGDMRILGDPPTPSGWPIQLECPGSDSSVSIELVSGSVCTTTKSRRVWNTTMGEQHHLRNPSTGESAETGIVSVSVVGARAIQCEVLAKVAFLVGMDQAADVVISHGATGLLVDDSGAIEMIDGLESFVSADGAGHTIV